MQTKMTRYLIYVGLIDKDQNKVYDKFRTFISKDLATYVSGATIQDAMGLWEGKTEGAKVIEILMAETAGGLGSGVIHDLATTLKTLLNQDTVLITKESVYATFI